MLILTRFLSLALLIQVASLGKVMAAEEDRRWVRVREPIVSRGLELMGAVMIDLNSVLESSDGWILYHSSAELSNYPYDIDNSYLLEIFVSYKAIHCANENLASSRNLPRFESSYFHFGKSRPSQGMDLAMARKKYDYVCNISGIRKIPHTVSQVLSLNKKENAMVPRPTIKYDRAVMLGLLKEVSTR